MEIKTRAVFSYIICVLSVLMLFAVEAGDRPGYGRFSTNFWLGDVGPSGPLFSGPHQYPFICYTLENGLGQPLVDNQDGIGNAVFPELNGIPIINADPVGYSENCSIATRVDYFYYSTLADDFLLLADPANVPADVEQLTLNNKSVNFVIRVERGTINRFIYSIAMLAPFPESLDKPKKLDNSAWNKKLVYSFQGGVGIGHFQGKFSLRKRNALHYESLKRGYAVAYSTGNRTGTHYNLTLMEETALMVKRHFKAIYGKPEFTIGVGGSGGAIQQYVIGQNNPHIIDAAIAQMSYPDMITQTIHLTDCELLERYFDMAFISDITSRWGDWLQRALIGGLVTNNTAIVDPWSSSLISPAPAPGSSECINGWRELLQGVHNPKATSTDYFEALELYRYPAEVINNIKWTHWDDLGNIYPKDENGIAYNTVDNVGVQYGLGALLKGSINTQEFLDINACVGGWKQPHEMQLEKFPWNPAGDPFEPDPWNAANMNLCGEGVFPAPRTEGNLTAMHAAYKSKQVFTGHFSMPVIDMRWYLEPILDMHHSQASFTTRARIKKKQGHAKNQVIWFIECSDMNPVTLKDNCEYDATGKALEVVDEWLTNLHRHHASHKKNKKDRVVASKPAEAQDACFYGNGDLLYAGDDAWDGILDNKPLGQCSSAFPIYSTSRIVAGEPIHGNIFKCSLKPVEVAIADGTYGNIVFTKFERELLQDIFPTGVCDYSKPDLGKPPKKWRRKKHNNWEKD